MLKNHIYPKGYMFRKEIGQHVLIDEGVLNKIVQEIPKDKVIFEIGAGPGTLTKFLVKKSKSVVAVELDKKFKPELSGISDSNKNLKIIFSDALDLLNPQIFTKTLQTSNNIWIAGNIPYHIVEPLIMKLIHLPIEGATFLTGARFANEIEAKPESANFGKLTMFVNTFFLNQVIEYVDKKSFDPPPRTTSAIVLLKLKSRSEILSDQSNYIVSELFLSSKRGTKLKNVLMDAIIRYHHFLSSGQTDFISKPELTKNEARLMVNSLDFPDTFLNKAIDQLSNSDFSLLAKNLKGLNIS